jgi:Domain of unknown function (DUF6362)
MEDRLDAQYVAIRLSEAGKTLLSLPNTGCAPAGFRSLWPSFAHNVIEAYGYEECEVRLSPPSNKAVSEMEQAFSWIQLIPKDQVRLRRIVLLRSLVSPRTDKPVFSYARIAQRFGCAKSWAKNQHMTGIYIITYALQGPGLCVRAGGHVGPGRAEMMKEWRRAARPAGLGRDFSEQTERFSVM